VKQPKWRIILYRVGMAVGIMLLGYQLYQSLGAFSVISAVPALLTRLVLALFCILLALGIQIAAWRTFMRSLGIEIPASSAYGQYYLSFVSRYIPGSVWGYFSRAAWLKEKHHIDYSQTNIGSMIEIGAGLLSIVVMAGIQRAVVEPGIIRLLAVAAILLLPAAIHQVIRIAARLIQPGVDRWGLSRLRNMRGFPFIWGVYLLTANWFLYGSALYLAGGALGFNLALPDYGHLTSLPLMYSLAWLAGFIIVFLPSGLGVRELALGIGLANHYVLDTHQATAIALLLRGTVLFGELVWFCVTFVISRRSPDHTPKEIHDRPEDF
jgi:uncharacterized membrane protein YbhN (UPF0104 family)